MENYHRGPGGGEHRPLQAKQERLCGVSQTICIRASDRKAQRRLEGRHGLLEAANQALILVTKRLRQAAAEF